MSDTDQNKKPRAPIAGPTSAGCPRWVKVTLFTSVALNLLIVGAVVGAVLRNDGRHGRPASVATGVDASVGPFAQALTRDQRKAVGDVLSENGPKLQAGSRAVRAQLAEMMGILRSEDFDPEAFSASVAMAQARLTERQTLAFDAVIDQIGQMTVEERVAFADRLERSFRRKPPRRR